MKEPDANPMAIPPAALGEASKNGRLSEQQALADFMGAFMRASGLPLEQSGKNGTGAKCWGMEIPGFCQIIHGTHSPHLSHMCGLFNRHLEEMAVDHPHEAECFAGIHLTAVPLRDKKEKVGYLKTGHMLPQQPAAADFRKVMRILSRAGLDCLAERAEKAWLALPVMDPERYKAFVDLLAAFASQISGKTTETKEIKETGEPAGCADSHALREAQRYIEKKFAERLKLSEVAHAVGLSPNYFCRKFHDFTGLSFTDYLAGIRVASAARLLREPRIRIKEVAYGTGFNSISQFNRVFRVTMGMSPSAFRQRMLAESEN